ETIAELTGTVPREDPLRAGRSFASRLLHPGRAEDDPPIVIHDEYGANRMIRTDGWKLVVRRDGPTELFDLLEDPHEEQNLAGDPSQAARLGDLAAALQAWFAAHREATLDGWEQRIDGS